MFVKYTDEKIIIDGLLNESDWEKTIPASGFFEHFPNHGNDKKNKATIKVMNNDEFLYIGIKIFVNPSRLKNDSFRRDFQAGNSDNVTLIFDTFND